MPQRSNDRIRKRLNGDIQTVNLIIIILTGETLCGTQCCGLGAAFVCATCDPATHLPELAGSYFVHRKFAGITWHCSDAVWNGNGAVACCTAYRVVVGCGALHIEELGMHCFSILLYIANATADNSASKTALLPKCQHQAKLCQRLPLRKIVTLHPRCVSLSCTPQTVQLVSLQHRRKLGATLLGFWCSLVKAVCIALAVLAASGASFAQSNVTIYGIVDAYVGVAKGADGVSQTVVNSGGVDGNRWGLKGSEDLGGGLKADFVLEQGFNVDTGAVGGNAAGNSNTTQAGGTSSQAFARYSAVGFSGGFGEVKLGKYSSAYDMVENGANAVFNSALSAEANTFRSGNSIGGIPTYNWNPSNGIYYATPDMGGFSGAVSYALGENKNAATGEGAGNITAFNLKYAQGPIYASLGYQTEKATGNASENKFGQINASYDFAVAKLQLAYGTAEVPNPAVTVKSNEWQIGVTAPVSTALSLSANYATSKDDDYAGSTGVKRSGIGLGAAYSLSKRTYVYGGYRAETAKRDGFDNVDTSLFAVGVHHVF